MTRFTLQKNNNADLSAEAPLEEPLWQQQGQEPDVSYKWFVMFSEIPSDMRSVKEFARRLKLSGARATTGTIHAIHARWQWERRASAMDLQRMQDRQRTWVMREDEWRENNWNVGSKLMEKATTALENVSASAMDDPRAIARLIEVGAKLREEAIPKLSLDSADEVRSLLDSLPTERAQRIRAVLMLDIDNG